MGLTHANVKFPSYRGKPWCQILSSLPIKYKGQIPHPWEKILIALNPVISFQGGPVGGYGKIDRCITAFR